MDNYLLPLTVNISVALCTYTAPLFMYIVSMIGMEGEIQFVCFIVSNNKHIKCSLLLIEGKDPVRCRYIYKFRVLHSPWGLKQGKTPIFGSQDVRDVMRQLPSKHLTAILRQDFEFHCRKLGEKSNLNSKSCSKSVRTW